MKRLLLLLVFSASLFASAQTVNVDELTATGSNTLTHVYIGDAGDDAGYTRTSITSVTLIPTGMRLGNTEYTLAGITELSELIHTSLGSDYASNLAAFSGGFWYQNNRGVFERVDSPVAINPLQAFIDDPNWDNPSNVFIRNACDQTFSVRHLASNESQQFVLNRIRGGYFEERYATAEEVISAVQARLTESSPLCDATINAIEYGWEPNGPSGFTVRECGYRFGILWSTTFNQFTITLNGNGAIHEFSLAGSTTREVRETISSTSAACELLALDEGWEIDASDRTVLYQVRCGTYYVARFVEGSANIYSGATAEEARTSETPIANGIDVDLVEDELRSTNCPT